MGLGRRRLIAGGGLALLAPAMIRPAWADALSSGAFRREVAAILRRRRPDLALTLPDDDPTTIRAGDLSIYLGNLYRQVQDQAGDSRRQEIERFLDQMARAGGPGQPAPETWVQARGRLRAQIVPIEYRTAGPKLVSRDFGRRVVIAYAVDSADSYQLVTADMATGWSVDAAAIHEAAIEGLEGISTNVEIEVETAEIGPGRYATIATRDGYDAARILAPRFLQRLRAALGDTVMIGIPNRDFLVAWTPDFAARAAFVAQIRKDVQTRSHPRTEELFVATADGVRPATKAETVAQSGG